MIRKLYPGGTGPQFEINGKICGIGPYEEIELQRKGRYVN